MLSFFISTFSRLRKNSNLLYNLIRVGVITVNYDEIGNFIAVLRKEKNLTQKDLAEKLGVTDKAVSKWERGLGCPDVSLLEALSKILNVSIRIIKGKENRRR